MRLGGRRVLTLIILFFFHNSKDRKTVGHHIGPGSVISVK